MAARADEGKEGRRRQRLLPVFLSALIVLPSSPFVASAAAQVVGAGESASAPGSVGSAGASAVGNAVSAAAPAPLALTAQTFAAPLTAASLIPTPDASMPAARPALLAPSAAAAATSPAAARPAAPAVAAAASELAAAALPAAADGPARADAAAARAPRANASPEFGGAGASADAAANKPLALLFDGAKGYSADTISVSLVRADGKPVTTTLAELGRVLTADPTLLNGLNAGGRVRLVLKSEAGASVPKTMGADLTSYLRERGISAPVSFARRNPFWISLDLSLLKNAPKLLRESWTVPNRQDYVYLATKTFGLNLAVRLFFAAAAVRKGSLPLPRAVLSTIWYQLQDAGFTLFGQTYMKFIGKMTGMLRIARGYFGDLLFTYLQLTTLEFLNRLVLGPIGENPLVYSWGGLSLIFANVFMGMLSGGPLIPAISKMRRAGIISQSMMMNLYQLASLTMQFGLVASFGYQHLYFVLTTATLMLSWAAYAFFTIFYKDMPGADAGLGGKKKE